MATVASCSTHMLIFHERKQTEPRTLASGQAKRLLMIKDLVETRSPVFIENSVPRG